MTSQSRRTCYGRPASIALYDSQYPQYRVLTTVNRKIGPGDEAGFTRHQIPHKAGDFFLFTETTNRNRRQYACQQGSQARWSCPCGSHYSWVIRC